MWLHLPPSHFAPATAESNWASAKVASDFARSVTWRSKHSPPRTWLQRFGRVSWMTLLSGATSKHLIPPHLLDAWISSLPGIPAKDSVTPASAKELKMLASYGLSSCGQLSLFAPGEFFLKTSRAISPSDCAKSLETWKHQVIVARGEYSARLKSALRIRESGCSSSDAWPSPDARDSHPEGEQAGLRRLEKWGTCGLQTAANLWPTPDVPNGGRALAPEIAANKGQKPDGTKAQVGLQNAVNLWPTPRSSPNENRQTKPSPSQVAGKHGKNLATEASQNWSTHRSSDGEKGGPNQRDSSGSQPLPAQVVSARPTPSAHDAKGANGEAHMTKDRPHLGQLPNAVIHQTAGQPAPENPNTNGNRPASCQLNPDWVETLMGVPIGWTDLGCSETVSYRPAQTELGLCSTRG
jgi:hypothetical protein